MVRQTVFTVCTYLVRVLIYVSCMLLLQITGLYFFLDFLNAREKRKLITRNILRLPSRDLLKN